MPNSIKTIEGEQREHNGTTIVRVVPPRQTFAWGEQPVALHHAIGPGQVQTPTYRIDTPEEGGFLNYQKGKKYPVKEWVFKEAVFSIDTIKRAILNLAKFLGSSPVRYFLPLFFLLPNRLQAKAISKAIELFSDYTSIVFDRWGRIMQFEDEKGTTFGLQSVVRLPKFYCDMVREVRRVGMDIASNDSERQFVEAVCMILEFDNGYRYPVQDLMGSMDVKAFLANPSKETARLLMLAQERGHGTKEKYQTIAAVLPFLFRVKCFREVLIRFFSEADMKKLALDEIDFYACLERGGWQYRGIPGEELASLRMLIDAEWTLKGEPQIQPT